MSVTLLPLHIVEEGEVLIVTVGSEFTVTVLVAVFVQPIAFVPVTVYVVFAVGLTVMAAVVCPPGDHIYVDAPDAVSVALAPIHIVDDGLAAIETVGVETVIKRVAVFVQPSALVPVTV